MAVQPFNTLNPSFLNLGSEVQVLSGTPFSAHFPVYKRERE